MSVIGNVDLIVAHEVTFPQPPLPLVDNLTRLEGGVDMTAVRFPAGVC